MYNSQAKLYSTEHFQHFLWPHSSMGEKLVRRDRSKSYNHYVHFHENWVKNTVARGRIYTLWVSLILLTGSFSRSYHIPNSSIDLKKIDSSPLVTVAHSLAQFHQNSMEELVEDTVKTHFEEGLDTYSPSIAPIDWKLFKTPSFIRQVWSKNCTAPVLHSFNSSYEISEKICTDIRFEFV